MQMHRRASLRRRPFLATMAAMAGGAILAACGSERAPAVPTAGSTTSSVGATMSVPGATPTTAAATTGNTGTTGATGAAAPAMVASTSSAASPGAGAAAGKTIASQVDTTGIKKGGSLIQSATSDIQSFNPVLAHDTSSSTINDLVFDPLVAIDPDTLNPIPRLAKKWDISPDGKTYTFSLQDGVKWHDGMPFSADDVKITYDLLMNTKSGTTRAAGLNEHIASVDVKDPMTVVFTLKDVIAPFLANDMYGIVPKHVFGAMKPEDVPTADFSTGKPIGTGPFKMQSYKQGDNVTLAGNRDYFRGATALDTYIYKIVPDSTVAFQQLKTGEVDVAAIRPELYDEARKQPNFDVITYDTFNYSLFVFNLDPMKSQLFGDVKVRQALCYAVDRQGIVQKIRNGLSTIGVGSQPIRSYAYKPDQITLKYEYDAKKAAQLLEEAGWMTGKDGIRTKDGKRFSFILRTYTDKANQDIMAVFQQNWQDIGVEMMPMYEDFSVFVSRIAKTHDFEMFYEGYAYGVDPDQTVRWSSKQWPNGLNYGAYSDPMVDMLLDQGTHTLDREKRTQIYVAIQNLIAADCPALITDFPKAIAGVSKRIRNYIPNAVSTSFNAYQWYTTDGK